MSTMRVVLMNTTDSIVLVAAKGADGVTYTVRVETPLGVYEAPTTKTNLLSIAAQITAVANS